MSISTSVVGNNKSRSKVRFVPHIKLEKYRTTKYQSCIELELEGDTKSKNQRKNQRKINEKINKEKNSFVIDLEDPDNIEYCVKIEIV